MLKKANIRWSAKQLTKSIEKGTVSFDNAVQRGYVWDQSRKSLLIHSLMEGYPVPAFFAAKDENGYSMLDGKQRSDAISKYITNQYELMGLPEVNLESGETMEINGLTFEKLPEELQDRIKDYSLTVYYFEGITDEEINELFYRLNNGKPLSAIELTRVKAKSIDTIKQIGKHELFNSALTEKAMNKYTNEDIVIKSWAILNTENPSFETKQIRPLLESADITEEEANIITMVYNKIVEVYKVLTNTNDKQDSKVAKRLITRTHLVSVIPTIANLIKTGEWNADQFANWARHFYAGKKSASINEKYNSAASNSSAKADSIKKRLEAIKEDYTEFVLKDKVVYKIEEKQINNDNINQELNNNEAYNTIINTLDEVAGTTEQNESQGQTNEQQEIEISA